MQSPLWKLTALAGVIGVGVMVVLHAQKNLTQQKDAAAQEFAQLPSKDSNTEEPWRPSLGDPETATERPPVQDEPQAEPTLAAATPATSGSGDADSWSFLYGSSSAPAAPENKSSVSVAGESASGPSAFPLPDLGPQSEPEPSLEPAPEPEVALEPAAPQAGDIQLAGLQFPTEIDGQDTAPPSVDDPISVTLAAGATGPRSAPSQQEPELAPQSEPEVATAGAIDIASVSEAPLRKLPSSLQAPALLTPPSEEPTSAEPLWPAPQPDVARALQQRDMPSEAPAADVEGSDRVLPAAGEAGDADGLAHPLFLADAPKAPGSTSPPRDRVREQPMELPAYPGVTAPPPAFPSADALAPLPAADDPFSNPPPRTREAPQSAPPTPATEDLGPSDPFPTSSIPRTAELSEPAPQPAEVPPFPDFASSEPPSSSPEPAFGGDPFPTRPVENSPALEPAPLPRTASGQPLELPPFPEIQPAAPSFDSPSPPPPRGDSITIQPAPGRSRTPATREENLAQPQPDRTLPVVRPEGVPSGPADPFGSPPPALTEPAPTPSTPAPPSFESLPQPGEMPAPGTLAGDGTLDDAPDGMQQPELQIEKDAPPRAVLNQPLVYNIRVRNVGQSAAHQVIVEDIIPRGATLKGTIPEAELDPRDNHLIWKLGSLEPGDEKLIRVQVVPIQAGEIGSVATVRFVGRVAARTVITAPKLDVAMSGPTEAVVGEEAVFRFKVTNNGDGEAANVVLRNVIPAVFEHPSGNDLEYEVGVLPAGESREVELAVTGASSGQAVNKAIVTVDGKELATAAADVVVLGARLALERTGPQRRFVGRTADFTTRVTNQSGNVLRNVTVEERLPAGMELAAVPEHGRFDRVRRTITWNVPEIPAGQTVQLKSSVVSADPGAYACSVQAWDQSGNRAEATSQLEVAGFSSLKVDVAQLTNNGGEIAVGEQVALRMTVKNRGSAAATQVAAEFEVPPELEFVSASPSTYSLNGSKVQFEPQATLGVGESVNIDIVCVARQAGTPRVAANLWSKELEPLRQEEAVVVFREDP